MFFNYLKSAGRHLGMARLYTCINILGLAVGTSCVLLAVLYGNDERNWDRFHDREPAIFRITTRVTAQDQSILSGGSGQVQGPAFGAKMPEIQKFVRVMGGDIYGEARANNKTIKLQLLYADESFFDVFTFPVLYGSVKSALKEINSVVITEKTALRFFGTADAVGRVLTMDGDPSFQKTGKPLVVFCVIKNPPRNSSIQFDLLHPFSFMQLSFDDKSWNSMYLSTFVLLSHTANPAAIVHQFDQIHKVHASSGRVKERNPEVRYGLQSLADIHLNPLYNSMGSREGGIVSDSKPVYSYLFLGIALFILLMATINFVNISTANALKRAGEVGIRRISGSTQVQIMFQFLVESALVCMASFVLALLLTSLILPVFNQLANKQITFQNVLDWKIAGYFVLVMVLNVILTGIYPAWILARFKASEILYNKIRLTTNHFLGRGLVILQFSAAVILIVISVVFRNQMNFIKNRDLGYNPHQVIRAHIAGNVFAKPIQSYLRNEAANVSSLGLISFGLEMGEASETRVGNKSIKSNYRVIDENYIPLLDIRIREGRNFSPDFPSDKTRSVIVNEAFLKAAGIRNAVGTNIQDSYFNRGPATIIGVVKDFHFGSLRNNIQPMAMFMNENLGNEILVKISPNQRQSALASFEKIYKKVMPDSVYDFTFLDERNAADYVEERRWQTIFACATAIAILICCLGLFSLAHLSTAQRFKEIGIRKVVGATVLDISLMVCRDFIKLVLISVLLASPVAFYIADKWLAGFAYRIDLQFWVFLLSGGLAIAAAILSVGLQAVKAALLDPVASLRST